jgi:hypothetical protein
VDVAIDGDTVLVTNGVYDSGGGVIPGYTLFNRLVITNDISVKSVNGPIVTIILGQPDPDTREFGTNAVRGVYMSSGILSGLTVSNGYTHFDYNIRDNSIGGGVFCLNITPIITNCIISGNKAPYHGGGIQYGTVKKSIINGNYAYTGGGLYESSVKNCIIRGNKAFIGGGASYGILNNCIISSNISQEVGGGVYMGTVNNSIITDNIAHRGGGGVLGGIVNNCIITCNKAVRSGGGTSDSILNNCTITGNVADYGGGTSVSVLTNCIAYYNHARKAGNNLYRVTHSFCCSDELIHGMNGNITNEPQLISVSHITTNSPCHGAGSTANVSGVDIDGEAWLDPPSIGCDEYLGLGTITGVLHVTIIAEALYTMVDFPIKLTADIQGKLYKNVWDIQNGPIFTNEVYVTHTWNTTGSYNVVLTAYNETFTDGISSSVTIHVVDTDYYVDVNNSSSIPPYTNWVSAATNIQDAINTAACGACVYIGTGVYMLSSQISISKSLHVKGTARENVIVNGSGNTRCFYLSDGVSLDSLTITNGYAEYNDSGGGVFCFSKTEVITNCTICGNKADFGGGIHYATVNNCNVKGNTAYAGGGLLYSDVLNSEIFYNTSIYDGGGVMYGTISNSIISGNQALMQFGGGTFDCFHINSIIIGNYSYRRGGGAYGGSLYNCIIIGNNAGIRGGGAYDGQLINCTISHNIAEYSGGGVYDSTLTNCIVYYNSAPTSNNIYNSKISYSCSPGLNGNGNISDPPHFVNTNNLNYRLLSSSPCINAGNNTSAFGEWDLDGNSRIIGCNVDMGAYEYVLTGAVISVQPAECNFGEVVIGGLTDMVVMVENSGVKDLVGNVTNVMAPFSIVSSIPYIVSTCSWENVVLRFAPEVEGTYTNEIVLTGGGNATVMLTGEGVPEPAGMFLFSLYIVIWGIVQQKDH